MTVIQHEDDYSKDQIDELTENLLKLDEKQLYYTLGGIYILDPRQVMEEKKQRGTQLIDIVSKSLYTKGGRKVASVEGGEESYIASLINETKIQMSMHSISLYFIFDAAKSRQIITSDSLLLHIKNSTVIFENRYPLFKKAFQAWIDGDYIVALHLLIPQIEAACLQITKNRGASILKPNGMGGYNLRTFGDLLWGKELQEVLGFEGVVYFLTLFADQRGFNLRNELCHGLKDTKEFNYEMANATMIALLHLVNCTTAGVE